MPITGSQKALMFARSGLARSGATRSDYFNPVGKVQIAGIDRTSNVLKGSLSISLVLDNQVDTASFIVAGFKPTEGSDIKIGLGHISNLLFGGTIISVETFYAGQSSNLYYQVNCVDYLWQLNTTAVNAYYDGLYGSPNPGANLTAMVQDLMSRFTTGFDFSTYVQGSVTSSSQFNLLGTVSEALNELARDVGASWYIDPGKALHFFVGAESGIVNPTTITGTEGLTSNFLYERNIAQIRTRVSAYYAEAEIPFGWLFDFPDYQLMLEGKALQGWPASGTFYIGGYAWTYTSIANVTGDQWFLDGLTGPGSQLNGWPGTFSSSPAFAPHTKVYRKLTVNDAAAQTALATLTGGTGIVEYQIVLDTATDVTQVTAAANAELSSYKDVEAAIRYDTRDKYALPGRTVTLSMSAPWLLTGSLKIQKVTISDIETAVENFGSSITNMGSWPKRAVEALPLRTDFIDMLNRTVT